MKAVKIFVVAFVTMLPVSAAAMCEWGAHEAASTAISFAAGQVYDETSQQCVDTVG